MAAEIIAKRGRGRPKGSKTKNRLADGSPVSIHSARRPRHYNLGEAAAELAMSRGTLYRKTLEHPVWKPSGRTARDVIYTEEQIKILSYVLRNRLSEDQGLELWESIDDQGLMDLVRKGKGG